MDVRSLGIRTQLMFARFEGEVIDRGPFFVIRTPSNPTYRWGNYLLFDRPPRAGDLARWTEIFEREVGAPPEIRHRVFAWDDPEGNVGVIEPFLEAGFELERERVLTAERLTAASFHPADLAVRILETDADWQKAVELQVRCRDDDESEEGYRIFRQRKMDSYRRMQEAGLGFWFGGFSGDRIVADLGLFAEYGLGRYQHVETDPEFRRRGFASALLIEAHAYARPRLGIERLVIHADPEYHAIELYRSLGFEDVEHTVGVEVNDSDRTSADSHAVVS